MKEGIHPKYFDNAEIKCACGNVIKTGSTRESMSIEVCSACHPFYTGKKKVVDTTGRVDRFKKRIEKSKQIKDDKGAPKSKRERKSIKRKKKADKK